MEILVNYHLQEVMESCSRTYREEERGEKEERGRAEEREDSQVRWGEVRWGKGDEMKGGTVKKKG